MNNSVPFRVRSDLVALLKYYGEEDPEATLDCFHVIAEDLQRGTVVLLDEGNNITVIKSSCPTVIQTWSDSKDSHSYVRTHMDSEGRRIYTPLD